MKTVELDITQIETNPKNYRKTYQGIEKLAESIATYGLLQNLVLLEYEPGKYHVHAGERRYRAIRMLCMQNTVSGEPRWKGPVRCVVISQFGLEDVVENEERAAVALWQTGARYAEEYERGIDQTLLASKVGKTQSHVSQCLRIHYGLCNKVKKMLDRLGPDALTLAQLLQLIKHKADNDDPDEEVQVAKCIEFLGKDRRRTTTPGGLKAERDRILSRFKDLENKRVPTHAKPYVDTLIAYLKGEKKRLKF